MSVGTGGAVSGGRRTDCSVGRQLGGERLAGLGRPCN
jgi:hypothetical protein